jgi:hypothetical protein
VRKSKVQHRLTKMTDKKEVASNVKQSRFSPYIDIFVIVANK